MTPEGCVERCPGCRYRELSEEESDAKKQSWAENWLQPLVDNIRPIEAPSKRWGYRKKALLHAESSSLGWRFGLLKRRGWETELIEISDCPLHSPELNRAVKAIASAFPREMPIAFVQVSGHFVTLVLKCKAVDEWRTCAKNAEEPLRRAGIGSLQINWNPSAGRRPLSSRHQELIFGEKILHDGETKYSALSFRQQIPELEKKAQILSENHLASFSPLAIVDLYSGAGTTLARWHLRGWNTLGVELMGEAVSVAEINAPHALVLKGRAEQRIPQIDSWLDENQRRSNFVLYTNPPREGHEPEVNEWILGAAPRGLAYLSCNPKSLARDLQALSDAYVARIAHPFDFFPQTDHVESLVLLRRRHVG